MSAKQLKASSQRRFQDHRPIGAPMILPAHHPAVRHGRTLFMKRVMMPNRYERVLKSGHNNRKIGRRVAKGRWAGMEIYTLTLEERRTCPETCENWLDCYGNKMHHPARWTAGRQLEERLDFELSWLARRHPDGFVVWLHVLGDFYSLPYVARWLEWLIRHPELHVYGYTAHSPSSEIGGALHTIARFHWRRFAMRFSNSGMPIMATRTSYRTELRGRTAAGIVCPAQTGDTDCCATCGLCWQTQQNIVFLGH
jgi:hypothetical protein